MSKLRWLLAIPLALSLANGPAVASSIRDRAGLFDANAVREAEAKLNQNERDSEVATTIETIDSLQGQSPDAVARTHAEASGAKGIFILIPKQEHKIVVLASRDYQKAFPRERRMAIENAFIARFKEGDFDGGLNAGVDTIGREIETARRELGGQLRHAETAPVGPNRRGRAGIPAPRGGNTFGLGSLLGIGLMIVAVLVGIRLLGSLFGGGRGGYAQGPGMGMGRP